ncbi:MAG: FAD-dependent oxidoreductase [Chloroflexota bacterium]
MKANIVVIGAGIVGTSVAYHLVRRGAQNVVLVDKGDPDNNDGSTSHAPGGLRTLTVSNFFTSLGYASRQVYDKLPLAIEGQEQFFRVGFVQVANHEERFNSYKRIQEMGIKHGIESYLLTPKEVSEHLPMIDHSTIYGGLYVPSSGTVKTSLIATSMRREAEKTGYLTTIGETQVTEVVAKNGRVEAVLTDNPNYPRIDCEQVVLASNIWAPILCQKLGVPMPLFPGEHQYIFTEPTSVLDPFKGVESGHPIGTMDDISVYFRQHDDRIGIGSYHHEARLVDPDKLRKDAKYPFTPEDFTDAWRLMKHHMPGLNDTKVSHGFNGLFSFTADHYPIIGESHVKGFWTAVGAWLSFASEVGNVLSRWMLEGDPGMDMSYADINRFHPHQSNDEFLRRQSKYYYEIGFDILHPNEVASSVRNLRFSPYHDRMEELGGEMVPLAGIESPWFYKSNEKLLEKYGDQFPHRTGYDGTFWSPIIGCEHIAMRENVGLMDWSAAIGPIEVFGPGALNYLNYLTSGQMDKAVGRISYTLMLSPNGGIKRDITVLRLAEDKFWILTGKSNMPAEIFWMKQHMPTDGSVVLQNRSEEFVSLGIWGPNARKVLEKVSPDDLSNEAFPFYTAKEIGVGMTQAMAIRISYAGDLGYELYAPVSFGRRLWDTLWEAGQAFDMTPIGLASLFSLRVEKGYKLTGSDMTVEHTAYESNMGWMVDLKKDDFVGKEALVAAKAEGRQQKLVTLVFDDPKALMYGYEPVFVADECVGYVTSGEFGYCVGKFIALAYLPIEHAKQGTAVKVRYTGHFYDGVVAEDVQFDPKNERLKA